jgi:putative acetyltransferase
MQIKIDDLRGPEIAALLQEHIHHMSSISPPESMHALDLNALRSPNITFWTAWEGNRLLGCCALKQLSSAHAEVKSMRTARTDLRKGVADKVLLVVVQTAQQRGYERLSLETGSQPEFAPARALYEKFGFTRCGPFGDYELDPLSVYMTKLLRTA